MRVHTDTHTDVELILVSKSFFGIIFFFAFLLEKRMHLFLNDTAEKKMAFHAGKRIDYVGEREGEGILYFYGKPFFSFSYCGNNSSSQKLSSLSLYKIFDLLVA